MYNPRMLYRTNYARSMTMLWCCWAVAIAVGAGSDSVSAWAQSPPRWTGLRADGTRITGEKLTLGPAPAPPGPLQDWLLGDQPLLDGPQPLRWLSDRTLPLTDSIPSFVETITGDRLPGKVVGFDEGREAPFTALPPHYLVRAECALSPAQPAASPTIRVVARHVRRVVWQKRDGQLGKPGTFYYRDGRSTTFRAVRFTDAGLNLLTAEGPRKVPYVEAAEIVLPSVDYWDAYFDELAGLCPDGTGRLLQFETTDGLIATTSRARLRLHSPGGPADANRWIHGVQPAWSLDALWVPQAGVAIVRSFAPTEVPLSRVAPVESRQRGWLTPQGPAARVNRNVQGSRLRSSEGEAGWGWGVKADSRLAFDMPSAARVFQSKVGLDRSVGGGGCVRARVRTSDGTEPPAYDSGLLVGSDVVSATGAVVLPEASGPRRLILEVDSAHDDRPANADPFDIRDVADWCEPLVELDGPATLTEIARRVERYLPAWQGWTVLTPGSLVPAWDELAPPPGQFAWGVVSRDGAPVRLERTIEVDAAARWLVLATSVAVANAPPKVEVWIDDEPVAEQAVPLRNAGQRDPPPLLVPLRDYVGRTIRVEIRLLPSMTSTPVHWRVIALSEQLPTLYRVFEDDGQWRATAVTEANGAEAASDRAIPVNNDAASGTRSIRFTGGRLFELELPRAVAVRETPQWGEYRYLRFAVRKPGGGRFAVELSPVEARDKPMRLDGGQGEPSFGAANRIYQAALPDQWLTLPHDLFGAFGRFDLQAVRAGSPDGPQIQFDAIYLARAPIDFDLVPLAAGPAVPNEAVRVQAVTAASARAAASVVTFTQPDGKSPAYGAIVGANGEALTCARAVGAVESKFAARLPDGKSVEATVVGVDKAQDLALLSLAAPGPYTPLDVHLPAALPLDQVYCHVTVAARPSDAETKSESKPESKPEGATPPVATSPVIAHSAVVLRDFRDLTWTQPSAAGPLVPGMPLVDASGRLIGLASRAHGNGILHVRPQNWTKLRK